MRPFKYSDITCFRNIKTDVFIGHHRSRLSPRFGFCEYCVANYLLHLRWKVSNLILNAYHQFHFVFIIKWKKITKQLHFGFSSFAFQFFKVNYRQVMENGNAWHKIHKATETNKNEYKIMKLLISLNSRLFLGKINAR